MKKQIGIILLISLNFFSSVYIYSQEPIKIIPLIRYSPYDLKNTIKSSFYITPYSSYIEGSNGEYMMRVNGEKLMTFVNKEYFVKEYIPSEALKLDSVFLITFDIDYKSRNAGLGFYPPRYYGIIENNNIYFYKNHDRKKYTLAELIQLEFGSIDKFREIQLTKYSNLLYTNSIDNTKHRGGNGLINEITVDYAKKNLLADFSFYTDYQRLDTAKAIDKFLSFLKKHIVITEQQQSLLSKAFSEKPQILKEKHLNINKYFYVDFNYESFLGHDIIAVLNDFLEKKQMDIISDKLKEHIYIRNQTYLKIVKLEREKQIELNGNNAKLYSDQEMLQQILNIIFY